MRCTLVFGAADFGLHASLTILSKFMAGPGVKFQCLASNHPDGRFPTCVSSLSGGNRDFAINLRNGLLLVGTDIIGDRRLL